LQRSLRAIALGRATRDSQVVVLVHEPTSGALPTPLTRTSDVPGVSGEPLTGIRTIASLALMETNNAVCLLSEARPFGPMGVGSLVGPCPNCESDQTGDCDADPEINDPLVGRCYECGHTLCTDFGNVLTRNNPHCDCCDEDEKLEENRSPDRARPTPPMKPLAKASRTTSSDRKAQRRRSTVRSGERLL
jgi:hypothetical protein